MTPIPPATPETPPPPSPDPRPFLPRLGRARFQLKFSLAIFSLMCISTTLIWWLGHGLVEHMSDAGLIAGPQYTAHMEVLNRAIIRTSIFSWVLAFGVALFFSHFIAGPVYRFERILREVKAGDLSMHVTLRKNDEMKDLARAFDEALGSLRDRLREEKSFLESCGAELEALAESLARGNRADEAAELHRIAEALKQRPTGFTLDPRARDAVPRPG